MHTHTYIHCVYDCRMVDDNNTNCLLMNVENFYNRYAVGGHFTLFEQPNTDHDGDCKVDLSHGSFIQ